MAKYKMKTLSGAALVAVILALCACTSVKKELGVGRNSPDEFLVVKRAPLTLPPDYTLRPPANPDGAAVPAVESANTVRASLLGKNEAPAVQGASEKAFLDKIGAATANPDIRRQIDEENGYISLTNRSVADKLIFWDDAPAPVENIPTSVVDPQAEAARIRKNLAEGKPVTEGVVPVIEKKQSTLDKLF